MASGKRLLVPFLTAGFPDGARFSAALRATADVGVDAIEVGIPFSDPLADGPTIQRASQKALDQGTTLRGVLNEIHGERLGSVAPLVLMTYVNPIHAMGLETFCSLAADAGVAGVLVSDLPPEEMPEFGSMLRTHGLDRIVLVAPTTRSDRIGHLMRHAGGYVYMVTRTGVTGAGGAFSTHLREQREAVRSVSDLPVVAGFGIRAVEDMERLEDCADGFVIGARLLEIIEGCASTHEVAEKVTVFLRPLRSFLDRR